MVAQQRWRKQLMDAEDFQDLYKLVRGNRAATAVTDARALFMEKKLTESLAKILHAQETFVESRSRMLKQNLEKQVDPKAKDAERQIKKLKRKQEKVLEAVKKFDELVPALEKLVEREKRKLAKQEAKDQADRETGASGGGSGPEAKVRGVKASQEKTFGLKKVEVVAWSESVAAVGGVVPRDPVQVARPADVVASFIRSYSQADENQKLDVIDRAFDFQAVESEADIHGEALYFIHTGTVSHLVRTPAEEEMEEALVLRSAIDGRAIRPLSRKAFLKLGLGRKMVLLTRKGGSGTGVVPADWEEDRVVEVSVEHDTTIREPGDEDTEDAANQIIDMAAFSQLLSAAQRTRIVPGADQIGHVRDREFKQRKYDLAFQAINSVFSQFTASAGQRLQQLRQEDSDIAAGRIKMSPKDLQAKRARDRLQTQEIDRAQRRFQVVLEGLRILQNTGPDQAPGEAR